MLTVTVPLGSLQCPNGILLVGLFLLKSINKNIEKIGRKKIDLQLKIL